MPVDDVVTVGGGRVRGTRSADGVVSSFLGIPHALAPFGPARLMPPQPPAPWEGIRPAAGFGPIPPQPAPPLPDVPTWTADAGDDILTVNVWLSDQREAG